MAAPRKTRPYAIVVVLEIQNEYTLEKLKSEPAAEWGLIRMSEAHVRELLEQTACERHFYLDEPEPPEVQQKFSRRNPRRGRRSGKEILPDMVDATGKCKVWLSEHVGHASSFTLLS